MKDIDGLVGGYREYLRTLNYSTRSVRYDPNRVLEFLQWVRDSYGLVSLSEIEGSHVSSFFVYLSSRKSSQSGRGLSGWYIRKYYSQLRRFSSYLRCMDLGDIEVNGGLCMGEVEGLSRPVLSVEEVDRLYEVCGEDSYGMRDRALLSIYYGCGLRLQEGASLELRDVNLGMREEGMGMLYVRKGKNYGQRYVPMVGRVVQDVKDYIEGCRREWVGSSIEGSFFVSYQGVSLGVSGLSRRFKVLKDRAGLSSSGGLHSLRHSIATHLLRGGMSLEQISLFLGHRWLDSTVIYTHIDEGRTDRHV